jgi:hypothetical protein
VDFIDIVTLIAVVVTVPPLAVVAFKLRRVAAERRPPSRSKAGPPERQPEPYPG